MKLPADFLGYRLTTGGDQRHIGFAQKYARGYGWKSCFIVGYYFEVVADGQLQAFKADPNNKGRYLRTGNLVDHCRPDHEYREAHVAVRRSLAGQPHMGVRPECQKLMRETNSFLPLALPLPLPRSRPGAR